MIRAIMEGVVFSQRHCLDVFKEMKVPFAEIMAAGGGGNSPLWRQMIADVFGCDVVATTNKEGPALGVAILAGVGVGMYKSVPEACAELISAGVKQTPDAARGETYEPYYRLYRELYGQLKEQFKVLAGL
jgi:xylulokinase